MTSRWASLRLDCAETAGDRLVHTAVAPLATELEREGLIRGWFFVRDPAPSPHLRLRFRLASDEEAQTLSARIHERLAERTRDGLVASVLPDTYEREVERYGATTMELSERMFHRDSQMVARAIELVHAAGDEELRWQFGLFAMTRMLEDFAFSLREQLHLLDAARERLLADHGGGKTVAAEINQQYREKRKAIDEALNPERHSFEGWPSFVELLNVRDHATASERFQLLQLARDGRLTVSLRSLHASYAHTFCNRLFATGQRFQELVLVTFLAKRVYSRLARLRG